MRIVGNTVGATTPRTNWNQTNPEMADYLKGRDALEMLIQNAQNTADDANNDAFNAQIDAAKAQLAADNAQTAADNAQNTANDALPKAGGTMSGPLNVTEPTENAHAASKGYVDGKVKTFTAVLTVNDWVGDAAPYKQTIGIEGILGTDHPHYGPVYSEDTTTMLAEKEAWMLVDDLDTADGSVTFTCLEDKPETNVTVQMEVHR